MYFVSSMKCMYLLIGSLVGVRTQTDVHLLQATAPHKHPGFSCRSQSRGLEFGNLTTGSIRTMVSPH